MKSLFTPIENDESHLCRVVIEEHESSYKYPRHFHPEHQLTYVFKSHGVRYVGNNIEKFSGEDLVLIGPNIPHCWMRNPDIPGQRSIVLIVYLKEAFLDKTWMKSCELERIYNLLRMSGRGIKFKKSVAIKIKKQLLKLPSLPYFEKLLLILQILNVLSQTEEYEFICEMDNTLCVEDGQSERLNKIYKYTESYFRKKITLAAIATHVNMSREYFSRYFRKTTKKSFFQFLNEYRINSACRLLVETDKQISEVCYASGFESVPFFYRQFKKFKNCQPNSYRLKFQQTIK